MDSLSQEQVEEFTQAFLVFDSTNKGHINRVDLAKVMRATGQNPTDDEINIMITEVDADGNGEISLDEFLEMIGKRIKESSGGNVLLEAFSDFDHDHNEVLTPDEIRRVMLTIGEKLTDEEIEALLKSIGVTNGKLTFAKFQELMLGQ
mmetsp:Transcript_19239/g.19982  ORF Transcript_19239/g.19982 Transcript_19239/m.19982 type:complete len:148 (-) Transcript_19239:310-753(-)